MLVFSKYLPMARSRVRRYSHVQRRQALILLSFFLLAYILPLGVRDLIVPDETRYAEIPREMIAGGSWVTPHLDGLRYFEKPVLGYWAHAAAIQLFGETNFAVRLPSALAVGLSTLLIGLLAVRSCAQEGQNNRWPAILAGLVYLSCFGVFGMGNTAVLDNLFSVFLTATIGCFYLATEDRAGSRGERVFLLLSGLSCGLAFLTKGFLALAVPVLVLVPYLVWQRRYRDLIRMSWLPLLIALLVTLPWGIAIAAKEPDFWHFFFWNEHIRRFLAANAQHKESIWYFFTAAPGLFMPWTFLVPAAAIGIRGRFGQPGGEGRLVRLALCWLVLPFLFFSISRGKLLTYILPCFAPFAILTAAGLTQVLKRDERRRSFQWGVAGCAILFGAILLAFVYVQLFGYHGFRPYRHPWKTTLAVDGLVGLVLVCVWSFRSAKGSNKIILFALAPLLLFFSAHFIVPERTLEAKAPGRLLERYDKHIGPDTIVISDEDTIRAVCWYLRRSDVYLLGPSGELGYGLKYKDAAGRLVDLKAALGLIHRHRGKTVLVARVKNLSRWQQQLPAPVFRIDSGAGGYAVVRF